MGEKNYCEKWPTGCQLCDLLLCDGKEETAFKRQRSANNIPFRMIGVNPIKCDPCKPTQPECGECEFAKPMTNADRIRSMGDEELAAWIDGSFNCADWCDTSKFPDGDCMEVPCLGCIIEWLRQAASEKESAGA